MITGRRAARTALVVAVAATGLGLFAPAAAPASCAAPSITVVGVPAVASTPLTSPDGASSQVVRLAPGASFTVTGELFVTGCDDTGGSGSFGPGCSAPQKHETTTPQKDVALTLTWNGREYPLGTADATGGLYETRWKATLPPEVTPGHGFAVLRAGTAVPVAVVVVG